MKRHNQYLGEFEHLALLTLAQLNGKSYGAQIRLQMHTLIGRDTSIGALYATLERLEKKGFIVSKLGEPTAQRGGRAKRYFELTSQGIDILKVTRNTLNIMWQGLEL